MALPVAVRSIPILTVVLLLLAAVAAPSAGFSQPDLQSAASRQREIVERIEREQSRNGPNSEGLIEPLSALALFHQENGDHSLAAAVIEQLRQVVRANYGLHSLEQVPLIRQLIANEEAVGNAETAWGLEQELLTLVRRHPDDLRTVPILRELADKRLKVMSRYLAGENPPQIVLGCYYDWPPSRNDVGTCLAGQRHDVIRALVSEAQGYYAEAIAVILENDLYSSDELRKLEIALVRASDLVREYNEAKGLGSRVPESPSRWLSEALAEPLRSTLEALERLARWDLPAPLDASALESTESPEPSPEAPSIVLNDYRVGRQSLERSFAYEAATSASPQKLIEAIVRIADWDLLYSHNASALRGYELAFRMLEKLGAQASIDRIFAPGTPVVLPSLAPNPFASDEKQASAGHIDVAFEITKYGSSRRIRILDTTTNAADASRDRLANLIKRSRFRPRVTEGEFARASSVVMRYYLSE